MYLEELKNYVDPFSNLILSPSWGLKTLLSRSTTGTRASTAVPVRAVRQELRPAGVSPQPHEGRSR